MNEKLVIENEKRFDEFVKRLESGHIYTHSGGMHADDVVATALINRLCDNYSITRPEIHRIFDKEEAAKLSEENIVFDIGMGEYDHHQADNEVRENGIPYAAVGKIYDVIGDESRIGQLKCILDDKIMDKVNSGLIKLLQLDMYGDFTRSLTDRIEQMNQKIQHLEQENAMLKESKLTESLPDVPVENKESCQIERDLYKKMYEDLLDRIFGK